MNEAAFQALHDAVDRNSPAVLLMPASGPGESKRTRFLGQTGDDLWVECPAGQRLLAEMLQRSGKLISIGFRSSEYQVSFCSAVRGYRRNYILSETAAVEAIAVAMPAEIEMTQRRAGYRVNVSLDAAIKTSAWLVDDSAPIDAVPSALPMAGDLRNLSVNGMGLILQSEKASPIKVALGDRLRIELSVGDRLLVVAGRVRQAPRRLPGGALRVGLTFEGVDRTIEGRRALWHIAHLVADLQRMEARRRRAG